MNTHIVDPKAEKGKTAWNYIWKYKTPEGFDDLAMFGDDETLIGLWFEGSRDDWRNTRECERRETPAFRDARRWLDEYFAGHDPGFMPNYRIEGLTLFRQAVIDEMLRIPYGTTVSYGDIAKAIAKKRGGRVSAQAVGGAVGWNPICIIIPCHRVIGADGSLTGYGGGLENKVSLLAHEGVVMDFSRHKRLPNGMILPLTKTKMYDTIPFGNGKLG